MGRFHSRFSVHAALIAAAGLSLGGPVVAGKSLQMRSGEQAAATLLTVETFKTMPVASRHALVASSSGTVTTATRVLELDALKVTDFGDEPATVDLR